MTVYVDDAGISYRGRRRHHLTADSKEELHTFAAKIGVRRCWYHGGRTHPHYDVTDPQRSSALLSGAIPVDTRRLSEIARRLAGGSISRREG